MSEHHQKTSRWLRFARNDNSDPASRLNNLLGIVSGLSLLWAIAIAIHPISRTTFGGLSVSAQDPFRPLLLSLVTGAAYVIRTVRLAEAFALFRPVTWLRRWSVWGAVALSTGTLALGMLCGSHVVGGGDSYGYISESRLWLEGHLHVPQAFMADIPWPNAQWAFAPLGYRPASEGVSLVPTYAPGFPLMMAAAERIAGPCAIYWVVPICGGLFVFATYLIACRFGRPMVGLAAAWLVATSPTTLFMLVNPMSDLPAAAAWALAIVWILGNTRRSALAAGLAAAVAIMVRPNLVPVAGVFALFALWSDRPGARSALLGRAPRRAPWFLAAAGLGVIAVGVVNQRLYGSPLVSGYGPLDYALGYFTKNVRSYLTWMASVETPAAFVGLASLVLPLSMIWTSPRERATLWFFAAFVAAVWVPFLFYGEFNAWWYLRFILPIWPLIMIGTASIVAAVYRVDRHWTRAVAVGALAVLGWRGVTEGMRRDAFSLANGEYKYIDSARVVQSQTRPESVILTVQHSGSVRHYAGRMTLRWDNVQPGWLDRAVDWLDANGHHPYLLLEDWEVEQLRREYGPSSAVGRVDWTPMVTLHASTTIHLYDAVAGTRASQKTETITVTRHGWSDWCVKPAAPPSAGWR